MSQFLRNSIRIIAALIFLAGFPSAYLMVRQGSPDRRHVMAGIAAGFALLGLFLWSLSMKSPTAKKTASIIILAGGFISGVMISYRIGASPAPPWSWDKSGYFQVVVGPYMDWLAAIIPWAVFLTLGSALLHKKGILTGMLILLNTVIALAVSFLIFGRGTIYIADYMPPVSPSKPPFYVYKILYLFLHLAILSVPVTAAALPQVLILKKIKILSVRKDIVIILLLWLIPLIACALKLLPQYGSTC